MVMCRSHSEFYVRIWNVYLISKLLWFVQNTGKICTDLGESIPTLFQSWKKAGKRDKENSLACGKDTDIGVIEKDGAKCQQKRLRVVVEWNTWACNVCSHYTISQVQDLYDWGIILPENAEEHPRRKQ